jgi:hypothetical protein
MRAAPAILESIEMKVLRVKPVFSAKTHFDSGSSWRPMRTPTIVAIQTALSNQLKPSNNHLFNMFPDALYLHRVSSMRCAMLPEASASPLTGGEISIEGGFGGPFKMPRPG